ncbi:recombinase family protein [Faecalibacterium prausnitzii]|uniref:recombinase family protein n=1 Tax=Faecalibacterium prausnitzii TaxID=853 RepID=UPI001FAAB26B|nr:recombinase family protein [Faecalibacterium prausnitzii]
MTAVIYARYSSDNQREESIEGQIRECTAYAEKNGITVVKHYIDRAISAKTDNRPEFQQMIKDSEKRLFDIVLVWKLDRFARNRYDSAHYEYQLERNHVKLVSATEPISDSPAGIMVKSMLTGMAEYYSAELSEKVVRGMTENVLKGKYNGGTIPIGYTVDEEKFFQIDPLKAPFVVEAFQRYNDGATMKELMNWLNDSGVTTNRNQKFTYNSIQTLLTNRRYIGENRFKDIVMPDSIPVIIEKELFDSVQDKIAKNRRAPARHKAEDDYLLTTKLFCGMCGAMMFGECGTSRNKNVHHYYKCANAKRTKTCKKRTVRKEWLEDLVVNETMKMIRDDDCIRSIVDAVMILQEQENTVLPLLEKQMKDIERGIENLLNAIQEGILTSSTKGRLEKLEAQQKELEIRIAEEKLAKPKVSADFVKFWLTNFRKLDPNVKSHRETLINTFVNAVYLYDEKVLITFNYKDGTKTITFDEIAAKDAPEGNGSDLGCFAPPRTPVSNGYRSFCFICLAKGAARVDSNSIDPPNSPAGKKAPVQQRRPLPAAETGRSCWGCGQQEARAAQGTTQPLGAATRVPFLRGSRHLPAHILHLSLTCDTIQVTETTQTEDFFYDLRYPEQPAQLSGRKRQSGHRDRVHHGAGYHHPSCRAHPH